MHGRSKPPKGLIWRVIMTLGGSGFGMLVSLGIALPLALGGAYAIFIGRYDLAATMGFTPILFSLACLHVRTRMSNPTQTPQLGS